MSVLPPVLDARPRAGSDFAALNRLVNDARLLDRRPVSYSVRVLLTLAFYAGTWAVVVVLGDSWFQLLAAAVLGVAFTQVAFLGHDGGHQQIFRSRRANDLLGLVLGDLLVGMSYGWWLDKHNRHHANPNKQDHDPDIAEGVFVFTTGQAAGRTGRLARAFSRRQAWLFFPLLTFEGIAVHVHSIRSLLPGSPRSRRGGSRAAEAALMGLHLVLYVGGLLVLMSPVKALLFVAIQQGLWGFYMGCSFAPNHKGMQIIGVDEELDYLRRQVLTSRNVRSGVFTNLLLGGLNFQIEHHLFPNMPRACLPRAQRLIRAYCAELHIPYCEVSLLGSYAAALRYLNGVGAALRS